MRNKFIPILALLMAMPTNIQATDNDVGGMGDVTAWKGAGTTKDVGVGDTSTLTATEITTKDVGVAGAGGSSSATLSLTPSQLSVTVPMSLPIHLAANGTVTTAEDAKIVNNSIGRVKVTNVDINSANGWSVINYDTDLSTYKVNEKKVGFTLNGIKTGDAGLTFDETKFPSLTGKNDTTSDELKLDYSAVVTPQANVLTEQEVAKVVFTVDWDSSESVPTGIHMSKEEATAFGYSYELLTDGTYSLTNMPDNVENIEFPSTIDGKAVTKLSFWNGGYSGPQHFEEFYSQNIKRVDLPNLDVIPTNYTYTNPTLKSVTIPNSVKTIGASAFGGCINLTSVIIPDTVIEIETYAFGGCRSLTSLTIPNSATTIGDYAFNLVSHVAYNGSATGSPWGAVNINLIDVREKDGLTYGYSSSLNGYILLKASKNITTANIPSTLNGKPVVKIGYNSFYHCSNLSSISIPASIKAIDAEAFKAHNSNLTSVSIPSTVTSIGSSAFYNVPHITYTGTATGAPWGALSIN